MPPPLRIHEAHQPGRRVLGVLQLNGADGVGIQLQLEAAVQRPEKRGGSGMEMGKPMEKQIISVWNSRMLETIHILGGQKDLKTKMTWWACWSSAAGEWAMLIPTPWDPKLASHCLVNLPKKIPKNSDDLK